MFVLHHTYCAFSLSGANDLGNDNESTSRRAYKKLVFDLNGEILRDIYAEESEEALSADAGGGPEGQLQAAKLQRKRHKYFKGRTPPTHPDDVTPIVSRHVLNLLNLTEDPERPAVGATWTKQWSSRKKRDAVDEVLLAELKEEEPEWVDYQQDELAVKMQVADSIFDNLLLETAQKLTGIFHKKRGITEPS